MTDPAAHRASQARFEQARVRSERRRETPDHPRIQVYRQVYFDKHQNVFVYGDRWYWECMNTYCQDWHFNSFGEHGSHDAALDGAMDHIRERHEAREEDT